MGKRSRKKERRRRPDGPRKRLDAPRFAEGRVEEALDWIAGAGWQDRASGHVHIEVPLALHHDQGRAVQRAVDALRRFPQIVSRLLRATKEAIEVVSMPLSRADADRMHERLCARAASGLAEQREALRMGLGASTETEPPEVATTYRAMAMTKADGILVKPVDDSWLAAVDAHGRVDGGRGRGEAVRVAQRDGRRAPVGRRDGVHDGDGRRARRPRRARHRRDAGGGRQARGGHRPRQRTADGGHRA